MIEIFKTSVTNKKTAGRVLRGLQAQLPDHSFNFDLEDCDRILRAQSNNLMCATEIMAVVKGLDVEISLFED